eukprot:gene4171-5220_t
MFSNGFSQYLNSGLYSDVTVIVNNKRYDTHKIILGYSSDYFSTILKNEVPQPTPHQQSLPSSSPSSHPLKTMKSSSSSNLLSSSSPGLISSSSSMNNNGSISLSSSSPIILPRSPSSPVSQSKHHSFHGNINSNNNSTSNNNSPTVNGNSVHPVPSSPSSSSMLISTSTTTTTTTTTTTSLLSTSNGNNTNNNLNGNITNGNGGPHNFSLNNSSLSISTHHHQNNNNNNNHNNNNGLTTTTSNSIISPSNSFIKHSSGIGSNRFLSSNNLLNTSASSSNLSSINKQSSNGNNNNNSTTPFLNRTTSATTLSTPVSNRSNSSSSSSSSSTTSWVKSNPNNHHQNSTNNLMNTTATPIRRTSTSISQSISLLLNSVKSKSSTSLPLANNPTSPRGKYSNGGSNHHHHHHNNHNNNHHNSASTRNNNNNGNINNLENNKNNSNILNNNTNNNNGKSNHQLCNSGNNSPLSLSSSCITFPISNTPKPVLRWSSGFPNHLVIEFEFRDDHYSNIGKIFEMVLSYMYQGKIDINDDNCISILFFSNFFQMNGLKKLVMDYISDHITRKKVLQWLQKSIEYNTEEIIPKCIYVIARNFSQIVETEAKASLKNDFSLFSFLPVDMFIQILGHSSLSVFSEFTIYLSICRYIESKKSRFESITQIQAESLFQHVRFPYLTYQEYTIVIQNPQVPHYLLTEGLIVRLGNFECPSSSVLQKRLANPRLMKRKTPGRVFEYSHDYDNKGVIYYLATNGYTSEWSNPALFPLDSSRIKITSSSIEKGNPHDIVDLNPTECWTKDVPSSWFAIDLGKNYSLILKYYTLRHGGNSKQDCPRNWVLQGSDDGLDWSTISRHVNEIHINSNFASHSWPVTNNSSPYRFFRILQIGHNSTNHNYFSISGIELYGDLYEV